MSRMRYGSHGDLIKVALTVTMLMTWACGGNRSSPPDAAARGTADTATAAAATGEDGCRYLTASDVEPYTGPLVSPPYRATDDAVANRSGDHCLYRGKDGREILFNHSAHGGQIAGTVTRRVPAVMDRLLHDGAGGVQGGSEQHGPADAVMGSAGPGPWDNSNWIPTGTLFAFKGDDFLEVDVSAASGGKPGAIDLATKAIGRLTQPLDYDGSKAVTLAPKPDARVPACQLIPRDRAEGILGSLAGDPQTDSEGTTCTYKVASADGDVSYPVAITWTNGYKQLNTLKRGMSMVSGLMGPAQGAFNVGRGPVGQVPAGHAEARFDAAEDVRRICKDGGRRRDGRRGQARAQDRHDADRPVGLGRAHQRDVADREPTRCRGHDQCWQRRLRQSQGASRRRLRAPLMGVSFEVVAGGAGNRVLSDHRVTAVKDALTARYGVAASRLTAGGAGDSQPLETNSTLEGRARNRRVELTRD